MVGLRINMVDFGTFLSDRKKADADFLSVEPKLLAMPDGAVVVLNFEGISMLTPSFADEFITRVRSVVWKDRVEIEGTDDSVLQNAIETADWV